MAAQENARIARAHFEAFNNRDFDREVDTLAPDTEWTNVATGETRRGIEGYRQFMQGWATAFPDGRTEVTRVCAGENTVVLEFAGRGTHNGPLATPAGEIPPSGRRLEVPFCEVFEFRGGRLAAVRLYFDSATLLRQIGAA
jgi:steroid delta-isomerase-like uncharacterized protein